MPSKPLPGRNRRRKPLLEKISSGLRVIASLAGLRYNRFKASPFYLLHPGNRRDTLLSGFASPCVRSGKGKNYA